MENNITLDYLNSLPLPELEKVLQDPKLKKFYPLFASWISSQEEAQTWNFSSLINAIDMSLTDPQAYFIYNPPGKISPEMALLLKLPQEVTMEIVLNSWLVYILENDLLQGDVIIPDDNFRHFLPDHIKYKDLSLSFLPNLLQDVFKPGGKGNRNLFDLAIKIREKLNSLS